MMRTSMTKAIRVSCDMYSNASSVMDYSCARRGLLGVLGPYESR